MHRDADRSRLVRQRARDRLPDPPGRVGRELEPAPPVELLDRADQAEVALLDQVEQRQAAPRIALRDRHHQPQVRLDQRVLGRHVVLLDALGEAHLVLARDQRHPPDRAQVHPHGVLGPLLRRGDRHAGGDRTAYAVEILLGLLGVRRVEVELFLVGAHAVCPMTSSSSPRTRCSAAASSLWRAWSPACGGAPDLALDAALLQLQDAHAQHRLRAGRLLLRRQRDVGDERAQRRVVLGQSRERVVEVCGEVCARAAGGVGGELVVGRPREVLAPEVAARQAANEELALGAERRLTGRSARGEGGPGGLSRATEADRGLGCGRGQPRRVCGQVETVRDLADQFSVHWSPFGCGCEQAARLLKSFVPTGGRTEISIGKNSANLKLDHCERLVKPLHKSFRTSRGEDIGRIGPLGHLHGAQLHPAVLGQASRAQHRLLPGAVGVEREQHHRGGLAQLRHLLGGERRAHDGHGVAEASLVHRQHVRVTLDHDDPTAPGGVRPGEVDPEQLASLVVDVVLRGVQILRPASLGHRPSAEAEHAPARVRQREHDAPAEAVVEAAALASALGQAGGHQLGRPEAVPLRPHDHPVPRARARSPPGTRAARPRPSPRPLRYSRAPRGLL